MNCYILKDIPDIIPIHLILKAEYETWVSKQNSFVKNWCESIKFLPEPGTFTVLPDVEGHVREVICIVTSYENFWEVGSLSTRLPEKNYKFLVPDAYYKTMAIAWGLGAYQYTRYKLPRCVPAKLLIGKDDDIENIVSAIYWVRDLINTPTDDLGPSEFSSVIQAFCKDYSLSFREWVGEELLKNNYPCIYTVGRASDDPPRLIEIRYGNKTHPLITLVGKGVCFDTGGLDIKSSAGMLIMKKDMGGAAHVLGLTRMIITAKLPIQLRVLIPIVENAVAGNAYRPGDVIKSRKGLTVEIGNTDAEGRLILADALTEAAAEVPSLIIDMSTLTGAARIALGTDLPGVFANNDVVIKDIIRKCEEVGDPIWRLPLFAMYRDSINSGIADLNNCSSDSYGGAITAALFLNEFVPPAIPWLHFDMMAWNLKPKPGRPVGGEALALRGLYHYLVSKYQGASNT